MILCRLKICRLRSAMHPLWLLLSFFTLFFICTWILTKCVCIHFTEVNIASLTLSTVCHTVSYYFNKLPGSCGTPRYLSNGQRRYSSTTVGYAVTYTCNTGYLRTSGSSSRTCQSNGLWSGTHPTCTRKSTLCHYISFTYWLQTSKRIAI